mgnify:CR=1 FL=1
MKYTKFDETGEQPMTISYIFESFANAKTVEDKIQTLQSFQKLDLPYDIRWDALIAAWTKQL